MLVRKSSASQL